MALKDQEIKIILDYVKKEPHTVQDISRLIKRSWVTTDSYLKQVKEKTGLIDIKTFRKGTQAALKIVFYCHADVALSDEIKESLFHRVKSSQFKQEFDFMDVYQFVPDNKKKAYSEEYNDEEISRNPRLIELFSQAKHTVYCFSGNLSFINMKEKNKPILSIIEEMAKRKVVFKIICRVNVASLTNLNKLSKLIEKYPASFEIRHHYQPLRGFIIDDKIARFKNEEPIQKYKKGELQKSTRIWYEIRDQEWVEWLQKVFWNLFRSSMDYESRQKELKNIF